MTFRNYTNSNKQKIVENNYKLNHKFMTYSSVKEKRSQWLSFTRAKYTIKEALDLLDSLIDESDPDVHVGNNIHAFQTAERLRNDFPDDDWLHLVGLIHDLGKILSIFGEPQHFVVGDTYVIGCKFSHKINFYQFFDENPDNKNTMFNTKYGIYKPHCGLDNLIMSWGHDEYLYQVLKNSNCSIPDVGLKIIRYHSFYALHKENEYLHLLSRQDKVKLLPLLKNFSKYDLYSKSDIIPDCNKLWDDYYCQLCKKYNLSGLVNF